MPCLAFSHGSGSATSGPFVSKFLAEYSTTLPQAPSGVLVIEAHAESDPVVVAGDTKLAMRAADLLRASNINVRVREGHLAMGHGEADARRGFQQTNLPFVTMSLRAGQSAAEHLAMGIALAPLRYEGILLLGSGLCVFHNFDILFSRSQDKVADGVKQSFDFDAWLRQTLNSENAERLDKLLGWESAPGGRVCHPAGAAEHFMPTLVIAGAAQDCPGRPIGESSHKGICGRTPRFACRHFDFRP